MVIYIFVRHKENTHRNITTAGTVNPPPSRKKAPGNVFMVAEYSVVYIGAYTRGIIASATPKNEFTFPVNYKHLSSRVFLNYLQIMDMVSRVLIECLKNLTEIKKYIYSLAQVTKRQINKNKN